jgi:hypothetical protein
LKEMAAGEKQTCIIVRCREEEEEKEEILR